MKISLTTLATALFAALPVFAQTNLWRGDAHSLARLDGTNIVWQIHADPAEGKPYFHPLATPDGTGLTDLRPADHPWHRGLWFSWKYINDLNYWEEDARTHRSEGETELLAEKLQPHDDGSATLEFSLSYHPWNAPALLTEKRVIEISAPANGSYEIHWTSEFTALTNVSLIRTPPPYQPSGVPWGGYAGLSLRLNPAARSWTFSSSSGATGVAALHGKPASWVKFSAGPGQPAVTIFDGPQNPRYPSPWYINQEMPYFSPALLFDKTLALSPGEPLTLRYRILITDHDRSNPSPKQEPK